MHLVRFVLGISCNGTETFHCTWWRLLMETFSALLAICAGNSPVTGEFPCTKASDAELWWFFFYLRINGWVNNYEVGDLRRHRVYYDATVMTWGYQLVVVVFIDHLGPTQVWFNKQNIHVTWNNNESIIHVPFNETKMRNGVCNVQQRTCLCNFCEDMLFLKLRIKDKKTNKQQT